MSNNMFIILQIKENINSFDIVSYEFYGVVIVVFVCESFIIISIISVTPGC